MKPQIIRIFLVQALQVKLVFWLYNVMGKLNSLKTRKLIWRLMLCFVVVKKKLFSIQKYHSKPKDRFKRQRKISHTSCENIPNTFNYEWLHFTFGSQVYKKKHLGPLGLDSLHLGGNSLRLTRLSGSCENHTMQSECVCNRHWEVIQYYCCIILFTLETNLLSSF